MKKTFVFITTLLLIALLSASCSSIGIGKKKENITVKVLTIKENEFDSFKKHLEEVFPQIEFEIFSTDLILAHEEIAPDDMPQRILEVIEETKADLYYGFSPTEYQADYPLVDLTSLISRDQTQFNEIQQKIIETNTSSDGTLTSLSPTFNRHVLFVNRKLFQDNGVPEPKSPMTMEEFRLSAQQLKENTNNIAGYELQHFKWKDTLQQAGEYLQGLQYINNDGQLLLDQPEWRDLAKQLLDDYKSGIMKNGTFEPHFAMRMGTGIYFGMATDFNGYSNLMHTEDTLSIMDIPFNPTNPTSNTYVGHSSFSIDGESSYADELWQVITYVMSKEAATHITDNMRLLGYVTYPELVPMGDFDLMSFTTNDRGGKLNDGDTLTFRLAEEANKHITSMLESEFLSYIDDTSDFDQMWLTIEEMVRDINSDESNFISNQ